MYRQFLAEMKVVNPRVRVIGLTATPFRMKSGMICAPENFLNAVCYEVGVRQLIVDGYLCKLITKAGCQKPDTSGLHVRAGEFVANETEALMDQDALVESACAEIAEYTRERKSCLVFASGVKHGEHLADVLRAKAGAEVGTVFGNTIAFNRARMLDDFRKGKLKYLVNVNVLTTGFDAPNIDCVALVRPTMSPGLYYQMCGRGFRLHPGKQDCLVLDFGGNVLRHGPVDQIKPPNARNGNGEAPGEGMPAVPQRHRRRLRHLPGLRLRLPAAGAAEARGDRHPPPASSPARSRRTSTSSRTCSTASTPSAARRENHPKTLRVDYEIGIQLVHLGMGLPGAHRVRAVEVREVVERRDRDAAPPNDCRGSRRSGAGRRAGADDGDQVPPRRRRAARAGRGACPGAKAAHGRMGRRAG